MNVQINGVVFVPYEPPPGLPQPPEDVRKAAAEMAMEMIGNGLFWIPVADE